MRVYINGAGVEVFTGARVLDGLNAYSDLVAKDVQAGILSVINAEGHTVYVDGRLQEGDRLVLVDPTDRDSGHGGAK